MNGFSKERELLRAYLLGRLPDDELMHTVEEKILLDDGFNEDVTLMEDSLIEDFLDGRLTSEDSVRFHEFFLISGERRSKLRIAQKLREYAARSPQRHAGGTPVKVRKGWFGSGVLTARPALGYAMAALVLLVSGVVIWRVAFYQSDADRGIGQLELAYQGRRPIESRTSIPFSYQPLSETRGEGSSNRDERARNRAELYLLEATQDRSNSKAHQALGILYLTDGKYNEALNEFSVALDNRPNDAALHNDIAAAHLEKANAEFNAGKESEGLESLAHALRSVNIALDLDRGYLSALFNRALIFQKMRLTKQAIEAWEAYLRHDPSSSWANEARENLGVLKNQNDSTKDSNRILEDFLAALGRDDDAETWRIASQTKELITGSMIQAQLATNLLDAWYAGDHSSAERYRRALVRLGELEERKAGDLFFPQLANYYSGLTDEKRRILWEAHHRMKAGYSFLKRAEWTDSGDAFREAKLLFAQAADQWEAYIAEYQLCYSLYQIENRIGEANTRLISLSQELEANRFLWPKTIVDAAIASTFTLTGDHSKAIEYNQRSLATAIDIADSYSIQKAHNQLTHEYWLLGRSDKALESIFRSLDHGDVYFQSGRQSCRNLIFATEGLYRLKLYDAAAAYAREQADIAENDLKDNWLAHTAHVNQALVHVERGNTSAAFQEIDAALRIADSFPDEGMRQRQRVKTRLINGHLQRRTGNCDAAIGNYDSVISHYAGTQFSVHVYEARKSRLSCLIELKKSSDVDREIAAVIEVFERNRKSITQEADRTIFFDREQSVYDLAADFAYSQVGDTEKAFWYVESSRARSLLSVTSPASRPLTLAETRRAFPAHVQALYYAVLPERILLWYISDSEVKATAIAIDSKDLTEKVDAYRTSVLEKRDRDELSQKASELYAILIEPLQASLRSDQPLCIVADKALHLIPFGSLVSPKTGEYLVESFPLLYSPSATVFIRETEKAAREHSSESESIFAVGNPSFSRNEYSELSDLPDAAVEAQTVASLYTEADLAIGAAATKKRFLEGIVRADLIHFAGHYLPSAGAPPSSKLLLAGTDLRADEISREQLQHTKLIILSACSTGIESFYNGEGVFSSARAFLTAGVPSIIASQWPVDSRATSRLMIKFHDYRKRGGLRTVDALRHAQLDMLRDKDSPYTSPYYWASFLPIGGFTVY